MTGSEVFVRLFFTGILILIADVITASLVASSERGGKAPSQVVDATIGALLIGGATLVLVGALGAIWTLGS